MANALFSPHSGFILGDAVYSGTAPLNTTYSLTQYNALKPADRVIYGATSATITATIGASRTAHVVAIPMHNATTVTLNGNDVPVPTAPTGPYGRLPLTTVMDLRSIGGGITGSSFTLVLSGSANIRLGALIWLGTLVEFTANFRPGPTQSSQYFNTKVQNDFGTDYTVRRRTRQRSFEFEVPSLIPQRNQLFEWVDSSEGSGLPSLFWPDPDVNDALIGTCGDEFQTTWEIRDYSPVNAIRFTERSKGIPFL